ncbi:hypothetical protein ACFTY8_06320 [Streptomyces mirabilis]|uniref:hypothetical protein n=1 Tax=Streptomyces mirabilis TaxID=68239 RepID=UPI00362E8A19
MKSSTTTAPPGVSSRAGSAGSSPGTLPVPPPSRISRSYGPCSSIRRQSPVDHLDLGPVGEDLGRDPGPPGVTLQLTSRTPSRAPDASHASPTPHPVPVSPIRPRAPPAKTCSRRRCSGRHAYAKP